MQYFINIYKTKLKLYLGDFFLITKTPCTRYLLVRYLSQLWKIILMQPVYGMLFWNMYLYVSNCIPNSYKLSFSQSYAKNIYLVITQILGYYRKRNEFLVPTSVVWQTYLLFTKCLHTLNTKKTRDSKLYLRPSYFLVLKCKNFILLELRISETLCL